MAVHRLFRPAMLCFSLLTACRDRDAGAGAAAAALPAVDPAMLADATGAVEAAYHGTERTPPDHAPKPSPGKNVWIISPLQSGEMAAVAPLAAKAAADSAGWKASLFDSSGNPVIFQTGVRQAIANKAEGIILHAIDCGTVRQPLEEARAAGIKIVAAQALDCDDPSVGGVPLFDASVNLDGRFSTYPAVLRAWGAVKADWVIAETGGRAKVIEFDQSDVPQGKYVREGFRQELQKCGTCQIARTVTFTQEGTGPKLKTAALDVFRELFDANAVHVPFDVQFYHGIADAIVESGYTAQLSVIGGEGHPYNLGLIRQHRAEDAALVFPAEWIGYAAVDTLNSLFHGEKPHDSGIGFRLVDHDHNLPEVGKSYAPVTDFKTAYRKAWGT